MTRALFVAAAAAAVALSSAPTAAAAPGDVPVPNMKSGASLGAQCTNTLKNIFGWDADGNVLACRGKGPAYWVDGGTLVGIRDVRSQCILDVYNVTKDFKRFVSAQSPDGYGLFCDYPNNHWDIHPIA